MNLRLTFEVATNLTAANDATVKATPFRSRRPSRRRVKRRSDRVAGESEKPSPVGVRFAVGVKKTGLTWLAFSNNRAEKNNWDSAKRSGEEGDLTKSRKRREKTRKNRPEPSGRNDGSGREESAKGGNVREERPVDKSKCSLRIGFCQAVLLETANFFEKRGRLDGGSKKIVLRKKEKNGNIPPRRSVFNDVAWFGRR